MRKAASGSTLAAIVSFNGGKNTLHLIDRLRLMVDCVYIVDNGSSTYSKDLLASKSTDSKVKILFLPENYGIGKALNLALEYAHNHNYKWFITFDQDSMPSLNMIKKNLEFQHAHRNSICFTPRLVTARDFETNNSEFSNSIVSYAITSGNMIAVDLALKIGGYDEIYFVDCVDFEFSLRLRRYGYEIFRVGSAQMAHGVGDETSVPKFLRKFYTRHSALRRYYQYRNIVFICKSYLFFFPGFCLKLLIGQFIQTFMLIVLENNRFENIQNIFLGLRDGILGRGGKLRSRS